MRRGSRVRETSDKRSPSTSEAYVLLSETVTAPAPLGLSAQPETLGGEMRETLRLGGPLALGQLGWMSTYIVDALMIGRLPHSALSISASSLGNTIYYALVFCAIRFLTGLEPLVAQAFGRETQDGRRECVHLFAQSLWFVLLGTPLVMAGTLGCIPLLGRFGVAPELVTETSRYLHALVWSTAPLILYFALRNYLQSINRVLLVTVSLLTANLINWLGDYALLFGHFGLPAMGIAGSGWSTVLVRVYALFLLLFALVRSTRALGTSFSLEMLRPNLVRLRQLARIGWPDALENITDLGFSTYMSVVCARLGTTLLAAHQVVLDLDAFVYMVPMGLSYATVIRVGQSAGKGSLRAIQRSANASVLLGLGYICVASALFAGMPRFWAERYTTDPAVVTAAVPIFLICGFLQIGDAINVLFSSALSGLGDTRTPFFANTLLYWIVGMPTSYYLAFHTSLSLQGLWLGRAAAAVLSAIVVAVAWRVRLRQLAGGYTRSAPFTLLQPIKMH